MPTLSDEKRKKVVLLLKRGDLSYRQIAREAGVGEGTVGNIAADEGLRRRGPTAAGADPVADHRKKEESRQQQRELVEAVREKSFRSFLNQMVADHVRPMPPAHVPRPSRAAKAAHLRYPFLLLSDWHFEEVVGLAGTMGLNSYDIPTACRRVYRVVHACIDWKRDIEAAGRFRVPELVVGLNGDFLTGTLHGLERHSDAPNIVRASLACGDLIALALRDLAAVFPVVRVEGVVGNHGRLPDDRKVPTKDPTRSWDYIAYQVAKRRLEAQANVTVTTPDSYGAMFEVGGHLVYMTHGNFIPNNLGVVGYGMRRFSSSLSSNLQATGKPLRFVFCGHWHASSSSEFSGIKAFIGPSLIGTQEFGFLSGGSVNSPAQELHVFDTDLGHVSRETLYGEGPGYSGTYEVAV